MTCTRATDYTASRALDLRVAFATPDQVVEAFRRDPRAITPAQFDRMRRCHATQLRRQHDPRWQRAKARRERTQALQQILTQPESTSRVIALACTLVGISPTDILGVDRDATRARSLACALLRDRGLSYPRIARAMGTASHTTARLCCTRARKEFAEDLDALRAMFQTGAAR